MRTFLLRLFFRIKTWWPLWFYLINHGARALYMENTPRLGAKEQRIVEALSRDGIAVSSLTELFPNKNMLDNMLRYVEMHKSEASAWDKKKFIETFWKEQFVLTPNDPFATFSLDEKIIGIANTYMGMCTRFKFHHLGLIWPAASGAEAVQSQRWHRDPEERRMLKAFIYLTDVDETAGPFTYLRETTYGKRFGSSFPQQPPEGVYPPAGAVEQVLPVQKLIKVMTGPAGTVIFCDTTGLHKGGYAIKKERIMFTAFYTAPSYSEKKRYSLSPEMDNILTTPAQQFAVRGH